MPPRPGYAALGALPVPSHDAVTRVERAARQAAGAFRHRLYGCAVHRPGPVRARRSGSALAGMGGRLFVNLRDRKSLAYSVTSFSSEQVDPGFFAFLHGDERGQAGRRDRRTP